MVREHCSSFFQNSACEFFPCHPDIPAEEFNCLFCYCPLYALGAKCGGDFVYLSNGIKSCENCAIPHKSSGTAHISEHIRQILDLAGCENGAGVSGGKRL